MISEYTIDNQRISEIKNKSHKKIIRTCDMCSRKDIVPYKDYLAQRDRRLNKNVKDMDVCYKCRYKLFPNPNKGKKFSIERRLEMSRKKRELLGHDSKYTKITNGYIIRYDLGKNIFVHREIYEKFYNDKLTPNDVVHHINTNSLDNRPENLVKIGFKEHTQLHRDSEKILGELIKRKVILFSKLDKKYYIDPDIDLSTLQISLGFNDVSILQQENKCLSRLDVNISSEIIKNIIRPVPLIAANMSTVVNSDFCIKLYELGALGIMHRAMGDADLVQEISKIANKCSITAASVGVGIDQIELAKKLIVAGANIILIDIAHGFTDAVFHSYSL